MSTMLANSISNITQKLWNLQPPLRKAFLPKLIMIIPYNLPERIRFQQKLDVGKVEAFLPSSQPRFRLLVRMIEIHKRHSHLCGNRLKMMMVKVAHFSAFILPLFPEIHPLRIFESPPEEQFLILIWSFFGLASSVLQSLNRHPLLLIQLLDLNIIELIVVQKFTEQDIQIRRPVANHLAPPYH